MITGGVFALIVVSGNAAVAPVLGTGLNTIMNLIGMMASGLAIDAAGFLGIEKKPVTLRKVIGMLLMLAGTALISFL
jgi:transporter family-2 protein